MLFPQYSKQEVTLIDASWLCYRSLYSREGQKISSHVGNAFAGPSFILYQSLLALLRWRKNLIFVLDGWPSHKMEKMPEYKAQRETSRQEDPNYQLNRGIRKQLRSWILQTLPSVIAYLPDQEADDCIGSLAAQLSAKGVDVHIIAKDHDMWQLITPKIKLWEFGNGGPEEITTDSVKSFFDGIEPLQIPLYKAWFGDPSDNIPKLYRMPSKYACPMIRACHSVDECEQRLEEFIPAESGKTNWREKFREFLPQARLNEDIATIDRSLKVPFAYFNPDPQPLQALFDSYMIRQFSAYDLFEPLRKQQELTLQLLVNNQLFDQSRVIAAESVKNLLV